MQTIHLSSFKLTERVSLETFTWAHLLCLWHGVGYLSLARAHWVVTQTWLGWLLKALGGCRLATYLTLTTGERFARASQVVCKISRYRSPWRYISLRSLFYALIATLKSRWLDLLSAWQNKRLFNRSPSLNSLSSQRCLVFCDSKYALRTLRRKLLDFTLARWLLHYLRAHNLLLLDRPSMLILLCNIVCILIIEMWLQPVVSTHHLYEYFLGILKPFEKTWIRHFKRFLVAVLQGSCLDLLFSIYKSDHSRTTCENKLALILKDNLDHFVAVAK